VRAVPVTINGAVSVIPRVPGVNRLVNWAPENQLRKSAGTLDT
jgi:hypothetical protein